MLPAWEENHDQRTAQLDITPHEPPRRLEPAPQKRNFAKRTEIVPLTQICMKCRTGYVWQAGVAAKFDPLGEFNPQGDCRNEKLAEPFVGFRNAGQWRVPTPVLAQQGNVSRRRRLGWFGFAPRGQKQSIFAPINAGAGGQIEDAAMVHPGVERRLVPVPHIGTPLVPQTGRC